MRVVVVAAGEVTPEDGRWLDGADLLIAADGGADRLAALGRRPDRIVGDLDSADPALVESLSATGTVVERHPPDKDASDTELALEAALAREPDEVLVLGALGGRRLDHALANLLLLTDPAVAARAVRLVDGPTTVRPLAAGRTLDLEADVGAVVSLLPIGGDAGGVRTTGLRWLLRGETLRAGRSRGLSNEVVTPGASVSLERGTLLVVEHHRTEGASIR